jgi:peptidoglycan hydrolase-like protein with peptidoglycan-binding domain
VQGLLNNIGYLQPWRHRTYVLPSYSPYAAGPDANGYYGSATSDAIATFQEYYAIPYTGQLGQCDLETYEALIQLIESASSNQTSGANQTDGAGQTASTPTASPSQTAQ